jgi:hypothetical protein
MGQYVTKVVDVKFILCIHRGVLLSRQSVAEFPTRRSRLNPRSGHAEFLIAKVTLVQVFSEYFDFPLHFSLNEMFHIH